MRLLGLGHLDKATMDALPRAELDAPGWAPELWPVHCFWSAAAPS